MTKFRSSCLGVLFLAGCATSSGVPASRISEPEIADAYVRLHRGGLLAHDEAAAVAIAPGIAVTNGHNRNLVAPQNLIGEARDYDLLFFRDGHRAVGMAAEPVVGRAVLAYGQGRDGDLRLAHGTVKAISNCPGCVVPAYFTFAGDAGPGFSGGPVVDLSGRLVGIIFGYQEVGGERLVFAYPMSRVRAELATMSEAAK